MPDNTSTVLNCFFRKCPITTQRKEVEKILKEERKVREDRAAFNVASVNENADHICWFCHVDVSNLENNKCAGCRKVTHALILNERTTSRFRRVTVANGARKQTGGDMQTTVSRCRRRSRKERRQRRG